MNKEKVIITIGLVVTVLLVATSSYTMAHYPNNNGTLGFIKSFPNAEYEAASEEKNNYVIELTDTNLIIPLRTPLAIIDPIQIPTTFQGTTENQIIGGEHIGKSLSSLGDTTTFLRILQIGDSHVRGHYFPLAVRHTLEQCFGSKATFNDKPLHKNSDCIATETGKAGVIYSSIGMNGACASHFAGNDMIRKIAEQRPDIVIISFGTNESSVDYFESEHTKMMDKLLSRISASCPNVKFLLTTPPGSFISKRSERTYRDKQGRLRYSYSIVQNENTRRVAQNIVAYGINHSIAVWDLYNISGGEQYACNNWKNAGLMNKDLIHFTANGYELQGNLLGEALLKAYNDYVGN